MDPDIALQVALDEEVPVEQRANAAQDLLLWLYGGGFMPTAWDQAADPDGRLLRQELQRIRGLRPVPRPLYPNEGR